MTIPREIGMNGEHGNDRDKGGGGEVFPWEGEETRVGRFCVEEKGRNYGKARNPCR